MLWAFGLALVFFCTAHYCAFAWFNTKPENQLDGSTQQSKKQDSVVQTQPIIQQQPEQTTNQIHLIRGLAEGPNLSVQPGTIPSPKSKVAILLVTCDLACNWKLDGRMQGRIAAGDMAKALVEPGAVFRVEATTEDRADTTSWTARVEASLTNVDLQLQIGSRCSAQI